MCPPLWVGDHAGPSWPSGRRASPSSIASEAGARSGWWCWTTRNWCAAAPSTRTRNGNWPRCTGRSPDARGAYGVVRHLAQLSRGRPTDANYAVDLRVAARWTGTPTPSRSCGARGTTPIWSDDLRRNRGPASRPVAAVPVPESGRLEGAAIGAAILLPLFGTSHGTRRCRPRHSPAPPVRRGGSGCPVLAPAPATHNPHPAPRPVLSSRCHSSAALF